MTTLNSSITTDHVHTQADVGGVVYLSGGDWDKPQRWDGVSGSSSNMGMSGAPSNWDGNTTSSGAGNVEVGDHLVRYRYLDERTGYVSNPSNEVTKTAAGGGSEFTFNIVASGGGPSGIERSADTHVSHIVLEATTSGGTEFYEVTRVLNAGVASVQYNVTDATLSASTFDWDNTGHDAPPYAQIIHIHRNIMFFAGSVIHSAGTCDVTNASTTVNNGSGTNWTDAAVDRYFQVDGDTANYKVSSVTNPGELELDSNYGGTTGSGKSYKIYRGKPNVIWHSKPLYPESVDPLYFTNVLQNRGDRVRGLATYGQELVILGEANMERWTYSAIPSVDGQINPIPGNRGTCWHRCVVNVEGVLYGMDREGVWMYEGNAPIPISQKIDDLFVDSTIDWDYAEKFHAAWLPRTREIRWWYAASGDTTPKDYIAYEPDHQRWSTGSYAQAITASDTIVSDGKYRLILGDENGYPWWGDTGTADGVDAANQVVSWTVDSGSTSGSVNVQSSGLYTSNNGLKGAPLYWVEGNQTQIISSNTTSVLTLDTAYNSAPSTGDTIEIGRINAVLKTKAISLNDLTQDQELRYLHVWFDPTSSSEILYVRVYVDYSATAKSDWEGKSDGTPGVTFPASGSTDIQIDLSNTDGYARVPIDLDMHRVVEFEFEVKESNVDLEMIGIAVDGMVSELEDML